MERRKFRETGQVLRRAVFLFVPLLGLARLAGAQEWTAASAAAALEKALVDAIARAENSVVAIARYRNDRPALPGGRLGAPTMPGRALPRRDQQEDNPNEFATGVVISRDGYILTNYHVLGDPTKNAYKVWVKRRPFDAVSATTAVEVKAGDPWTDLAVLKVDADDLAPITFGDASRLRKGQIVIALGNPYNLAQDGDVSASWGIISNLERKAPVSPEGFSPDVAAGSLYAYGGLIQTDAKLNLGTSGGALVNLKGEMVGLITALAAREGYERSVGYAIPVDATFLKTVQTLKRGRRPAFGFLGVSPADLSDAMRREGFQGAVVSRVVPGTPAATAQLREGDLITRVDGQPVWDRDSLMRRLGSHPAASTIRLTIERGVEPGRRGRVFETSVKLSKKYVPAIRPAYAQVEEPTWRGLRVDYATALPPRLLARAFQRNVPVGCLAVVEVAADSPAWKAGLRPGNLLTHVDDRRVSTPQAFYAAVAGRDGPVRLRMVVASQPVIVVPP